ncbi:enoyl-CoA hydratase/isomerase family protein [Ramlibacter sp. WS9]|uniref:enoyl-CoA hydratase/isomerase family protein n=1 Tax=Ramlibacter sp. WS9 TaxID=1882741 RepID=UPI0011415D26|nr:enoyl-CoA hydratase/isomerase family protein [Ramlibacter sp. WS9]
MSTVTTQTREATAVITVSNPPHGYMTDTLVGQLYRAFRTVERAPEVRVVIFTGGGAGVFIQHYDLQELKLLCRKLNDRGVRYGATDHTPERDMDLLFRGIENSRKPVIAALNGNAMGFGCELALACDFRVMQDGPFSIGQPEIRVGLVPGAGGTQRLARIVGMARALDLVLHGRRLSPAQALAQGLIHDLVQADVPVLDVALERARDLAGLSPTAVAHGKKLVRHAIEASLYDGLDIERSLFVDTLASPEALRLVDSAISSDRDFRHL